MPPLGLHTIVAKEIADKLGSSLLDDYRGTFYLGSTAPDIRIIARCDRRLTHFFDLDSFEEQSGPEELLQRHPELAEVKKLEGVTVAFMAGYIAHLIMDETWIKDIFRPFFGDQSALAGSPEAKIRDRALQFALDAEGRRDPELVAHVVDNIRQSEPEVEVGFIDRKSLSRWRTMMVDLVGKSPDWDNFPMVAALYLQEAGIEGPEAITHFQEELPQLVEETREYLTEERIDSFLDDSMNRGRQMVKEYLCYG